MVQRKFSVPLFARKQGFSDAIATVLHDVVARESLRNELRLAYVRAIVLIVATTLDILVFFFPKALLGQDSISPTIALLSLSATVLSIGLLLLLRKQSVRQWVTWLQILIPLFDGLLLSSFVTNIWQALGDVQPSIIANIAAFCCLLAVSGGIRLERRSAVITTALALINFAYAAHLFRLNIAIGLFAAFTIFGTGFLGLWISDIVRRQLQNEVGRVLMERFLPKSVVAAAFETPLDLLQTPRLYDVTIMVTDLRSFTHFSENLAPVEVLEFLNHLQGFLSTVVEAHGGWVDKFMGDGMLAVFGPPTTLENHSEKALQAAIVMLRDIDSFSPLPIGIGLHSGPIVAGCLGEGSHLEFTVIGDTVNVASRLEALTKQEGYSLLLSETTFSRLEDSSNLKSLGLHKIRGREDSLEVFTLKARRLA